MPVILTILGTIILGMLGLSLIQGVTPKQPEPAAICAVTVETKLAYLERYNEDLGPMSFAPCKWLPLEADI